MKENKYDQAAFFQQYRQMNRSKEGLAGAGEWHELEKCCLISKTNVFLI